MMKFIKECCQVDIFILIYITLNVAGNILTTIFLVRYYRVFISHNNVKVTFSYVAISDHSRS